MIFSATDSWQSAQRILCVRLDSLGDVLMTEPALRSLKGLPSHPTITLLTSPGGLAAARLLPEVDDCWSAEVAWLKHTPPRESSVNDRDLIERLRNGRFDACVIFTVLTQNPLPSAMMAYLADIPLRLAHCRENPYQLLTYWVPDTETIHGARHEVQRQLDLVQSIGASVDDQRIRIRLAADIQAETQQRLRSQQLLPPTKWCVIHPGASAASRRYPAERWGQVANLLEQQGFRIVITGGGMETELVEEVAAWCSDPWPLAGCLDVERLAALIAQTPVLLTGNTGPAHIAAAVGTPVVDLYALTNPQHTPWQVPCRVLNVDVPCRNCLKSVCPQGHHDCLRRLSPEQVLLAVLDLWQACYGRADANQEKSLCTR